MRLMWMVVVCGLAGCLFAEDYQVRPPAPPRPVELPAEVKQAFPADEKGRPMLASSTAGGDGALQIAIVYDETLDDPITKWGACLERVVACKRANPKQSIRDCVPLIPRCASDAGGAACCPGPCLDAFASARATGVSDLIAVEQTFIKGDCVAGLADFLAGPVQP